MCSDTDTRVRRFLDDHATLTLACSNAEGPWAADVYFVRVERSLFFFSSPASRHAAALATDPRAAGTVHGCYEGAGDIRGVQMAGSVSRVSGALDQARVLAPYILKFPFVQSLFEAAGDALRTKVHLYRFTPREVFWVDNSNGLGNRTRVGW